MKIISLMENWQLREEPLSTHCEDAEQVFSKNQDWMDIPSLPCDVYTALERSGRIEAPLVGLNTFDCAWVEDRSWWYKKTFHLGPEDIGIFGAELFMEILDIRADIFVNGSHIAHHASSMYPFCKDISPWLQAGENTLLVRLTTGLEYVNDAELEPIRDFVACEWRSRRKGRGEEGRVMLRKMQNTFGWDQTPRLPTCAIAGEVRLTILNEIVVRDIRFETLELYENKARILAEAEIESRERIFARDCVATITVMHEGKVVHTATKSYLSQVGLNYIDFSFTMENPNLWWPHGHGDQPLYTVKVSASNHLGQTDEKEITTGVRTVQVDQSPLPDNSRRFTFVVNGKPIYCKGMDYIPANVQYAKVTKAHLEKLFTNAREANFNMIRFWDGNRYEQDYAYELCDRLGLLVHQGFAFACGAYPDHVESFRDLVEKEAAYQLRRLRNHPCIALWCGNGECNGLLNNFLKQRFFDNHHPAIHPGGMDIFGQILPRLHHNYVATVGYVCCSPFGGFEHQQSAQRGDCHRYPFLNLNPDYQQTRISVESFDNIETRFLTEGGAMGPPSAEVLVSYLGGIEHFSDESPVFEHHRNTFERFAVRDAIYRHYTGEKQLSLEEYCYYGGLFQGDLLSYLADHLRVLPECSGSVLWCLDDCFGEVGFSLLDHYGNPKPAYYFLRRAYHPNRMVMRRNGDTVSLYCSNDGPEPRTLHITYGHLTYNGVYTNAETATVSLPAYTKYTEVAQICVQGLDLTGGTLYATAEEEDVLPITLRSGDYRTRNMPGKTALQITNVIRCGQSLTFDITSDVFAHGVHFGLGAEYKFSDLYFDLLPGESRRITLHDAKDITPQQLQPACAEP